MVMWWLIVIALDISTLSKVQWTWCENEVNEFININLNYEEEKEKLKNDPKKLLEYIRLKIELMNLNQDKQNLENINFIEFIYYTPHTQIKYDFYDFVILDENLESNGYLVNKHFMFGNKYCSSKYVICKSTWDELKKNNSCVNCPICQKHLNIDDFTWIETKNNNIQSDNKIIKYVFNDRLCNTHIDIFDLDSINDDTKLYKFEELDFDSSLRYKINSSLPYYQNIMNKYNFTTMRTSEEFDNLIKNKFEFLDYIDWSNIVIAGGFCRSLLLNQPVSDLDFFIYGLNDDESRLEKFYSLRNNIIDGIKNKLLNKYDHQN